jgi:tetratricopeptide (TPR) repeat protein
MRFSFIHNGLVWQEFVARLFVADRDRSKSPVRNFETISAERLRDYGLDGIASGRTTKIFQMFFPLWEPGEPRHKRVNSKLSETCRKLKDNASEINAIIGRPVDRLILVIPENPDVEMLKHKRKLEENAPFKINIWGETEITNLLNRHVAAVRDLLPFRVEPLDLEKVLKEARELLLRGDLVKAKSYYEEAEFHSLVSDDSKALCRAKNGLASISYETGELQLARSYALDAAKIARREDPKFLPKVLINLGQIEGSLGHDQESGKCLRQALWHARKHDERELVPAIESLQARLALNQGDLKRASRLLDKCFAPSQKEGGNAFVLVLEFKAEIARREGDTDSAINWLKQAIEVAERDTTPLVVAKLSMKLAELLFSQKQFEDTRQVLETAVARFHQSSQEKDELLARLYIAKTLIFDSKYYEAGNLLPAAIERSHELGMYFLAGEANLLLAEVAAQTKEWQKALDHADAGYEDFAWENATKEQIRALLTMGRVAERAAIEDGIKGMWDKAEEARLQALKLIERIPKDDVPSELVMDVCTELAHSRELSGNFEESIAILAISPAGSLRDEERRQYAQQFIEDGIKRCHEKIRIRDLLRKARDHERPLEWAKTQDAKTLQETHVRAFSPLLEWMDVWPQARPELLDFWGRGNFIRLLLNQQASKKGQLGEAFTLCVEVTTVEQARLACRILYPIVDCLVLIWKGTIEEGMVIVPQHIDYEGPGGWGYSTCAGSEMRAEGEEDAQWCPALGWARPLPREIVDFVFVEARPLIERGRLLLVPAALVGCEFRGHGYFEKLLIQELLGASPVLIEVSGEQPHISGFPVVVPYFPEVPLADLAKVVDDNEEILIETRAACLEWGAKIHKEGGELSEHGKQLISARIKGAMVRIKNALQTVSGRMPSRAPFNLTDEQLNPSAIVVPTSESPPAMGLTSSGLYAALHEDALPWYPLWQLQSSVGGYWRIAGPKLPPPKQRDDSSSPPTNRISSHWIQPPEGGWMIPTMMI